MTPKTYCLPLVRPLCLALALALPSAALYAQAKPAQPRTADYILAVVNQELVTAAELQLRMAQVRAEAKSRSASLPSDDELRRQLLEALINERVQTTYARDAGQRIDEGELDRGVANIAAQNQISLTQLRERLLAEGMDYTRFRNNIRDQMQLERVREREVQARVKVSDADIDTWIAAQRAEAATAVQYNIAQVFVSVPEGAAPPQIAERRAQAEAALARIQRGEDFAAVAAQLSEDANKTRGGELGLRPTNRLPDAFVQAVASLQPGQVAPALLQSPAGFHVLKLVDKGTGEAFTVTQTHARHILLRNTPQTSAEALARRLLGLKQQISSGSKTFEQLAREQSEDGSAPQGGDLGWASPGGFVPEFEDVMDQLPIGTVSDPVPTRFGVHLIQVIERRLTTLNAKQQRERARAVLREQKAEIAQTEWVRELRARAYVELREPPQ
jgi:peptidyl-prolyl cis-trans isomerase SurA